jgi:hypothetical protein
MLDLHQLIRGFFLLLSCLSPEFFSASYPKKAKSNDPKIPMALSHIDTKNNGFPLKKMNSGIFFT